ncbi:unnamed protein product [Porites evermanni]|uniref:Uncharacterized protein n=1 Tax=Porites evermanni TaxID=104178 RepID=A0ABN8N036_9CNID|nr:unnamed protein product [Porites evermanni]
MKWGILILFPGAINIVLQCFFTAAKASVNSGNLIIGNGEVLEINTTAPSIVNNNCPSCNYNASHEKRSSSSSHGEHLAAVIRFSGNIEFRNGSTVQVFGKYGLSITSQNGHILIETDINMTCTKKVLNETCLGGFTQSSVAVTSGDNKLLHKGLGPGGLIINTASFILDHACIPGSSHGGIALRLGNALYSNLVYDQKDKVSLLGGSGGSCALRPGSAAGGGAIEIVADKGCITINAIIRASAQSETVESCSGGSGGLIRLNASHVELKEQGKLIVDGGNGKRGSGAAFHLGGGAGGIIQIISAAGHLSPKALSLKRGTLVGTCTPDTEHGYYFIADISRGDNVEIYPPTNPYKWSSSSSLSSPLQCFSVTPTHQSFTGTTFVVTSSGSTSPLQFSLVARSAIMGISTDSVLSPSASQVQSSTPSTSQGPAVNEFMEKWEAIYASLIQSGKLNESAILENLATHKLLLSNNRSPKDLEDLCLNIFENYTAIELEIAKRDPAFAVVSLQGILNAASECILEKNHNFWKQNQQMPNLMETLEDVLIATVNGNSSLEINYTVTFSNIVAQVERNFVEAVVEDIKIPHHPNVPEDSWNKESDYALIPKETFEDGKENYTYVFVLYKDVKNSLPNSRSGIGEDLEVSSFVMSCFLMLDGKPVTKLSRPALLNFTTSTYNVNFTTSEVENSKKQCSYWNVHKSLWANDGVKEEKNEPSSTRTVCQTNHFTSFAVLIKHQNTQNSKKDKLALSIITYIGCGVSTAALAITLIVLLSIESLSSERHKIHMNLALSLLLAQALFLAGIRKTSDKVLCKTIAVFLHYFFMTAFTWMLVEGVHLYLKVVQVYKSENLKMFYYYASGWGFPLIPVIIAVALRPDSYGSREICWLSMEDGTVWAFIGPVIAVITINSFILFKVVHTVVTSAKAVKNSEHMHVKAGIKGLFVLMPILGVGWILGLFAVNKNTIVFEYAFAIINGLQGLLIFLLHCAFNSEVRQAFRRIREKSALSKEYDSNYQASFSLSQTGSSSSKKSLHSNSFDKLKAKMSFSQKKTTKLVQVQPLDESQDVAENSLQIKRTFQGNNLNKLGVTNIATEMSSLNSLTVDDEERSSLK